MSAVMSSSLTLELLRGDSKFMKALLHSLLISASILATSSSARAADVAPAFEVNVLWPFFPGGLTDFKLLAPMFRADQEDFRGEAVIGLHSDFGWRVIRETNYGQVAILAAKVGYRQFFVSGF